MQERGCKWPIAGLRLVALVSSDRYRRSLLGPGLGFSSAEFHKGVVDLWGTWIMCRLIPDFISLSGERCPDNHASNPSVQGFLARVCYLQHRWGSSYDASCKQGRRIVQVCWRWRVCSCRGVFDCLNWGHFAYIVRWWVLVCVHTVQKIHSTSPFPRRAPRLSYHKFARTTPMTKCGLRQRLVVEDVQVCWKLTMWQQDWCTSMCVTTCLLTRAEDVQR